MVECHLCTVEVRSSSLLISILNIIGNSVTCNVGLRRDYLLNSAVQGVQTKVVKAGPKVDKKYVLYPLREQRYNKISKRLNQLKVRSTRLTRGGFTTKFFLKKGIQTNLKKGAGGDYVPDFVTNKLAESSQAGYAALVFNVLFVKRLSLM